MYKARSLIVVLVLFVLFLSVNSQGSNTGPVLFPTVRNDPSNPTPENANFDFFK
ncbi:hypothetical protein TcasGA2_TC034115 [Tribolium castaneum]|uniref:Uncharacterized protein n=1 Tax=Tribolium castaneum TaxID=7070 RepID=A0A139WDD9_TRICA|nr:hypothetical protein TcasGA2_TC034115 [Tribolium castaneum]